MGNRKILIVDDEPAIRDLLTQMLELSDYQAFSAINGEEGLRIFQEVQPDLVISDVLMPVMGGHEFCLRLRQRSNVPIIMLSGQVNLESEREKIQSMGISIDAIMSKPIPMGKFLDIIESLLGEGRPALRA